MPNPLNTQKLLNVANDYTQGKTEVAALLYQQTPAAVPFQMISSGVSEYTCTFSTGATFPVRQGARVTLANVSGTSFYPDMFLVAVAGQPTQFRLSGSYPTSAGDGNAVNAPLPANATIVEKVITPEWQLATLVKYEVSGTGLGRQTATYPGSATIVAAGGGEPRKATRGSTTVNFVNSTAAAVSVSHILTLENGVATLGDTTAVAYHLEPAVVSQLGVGDALAVTVNFDVESKFN